MASEWYYAQDDQQQGPISPEALKELASDGTLKSGDLVWKEGMDDWAPAGRIKGLLPTDASSADYEIEPYEIESYDLPNRPRGALGQIALIASAVLMITAMFVPWWSLWINAESDTEESSAQLLGLRRKAILSTGREAESLRKTIEQDSELKTEEARTLRRNYLALLKLASQDREWWNTHCAGGKRSFNAHLTDLTDDAIDEESSSLALQISGLREGVAIMGLVFGVLILVLSPVFLFTRTLREWNWIVSLMAAVIGFLTGIFSRFWILASPDSDAGALFQQGDSVGPYLLLVGSALFLIVGTVDTVFGIAAQTRVRREAA